MYGTEENSSHHSSVADLSSLSGSREVSILHNKLMINVTGLRRQLEHFRGKELNNDKSATSICEADLNLYGV